MHDDGHKELGTCLETLPVSEAYANYVRDKQPTSKKRKHHSRSNPELKPEVTAAVIEVVGSAAKDPTEQATSSQSSQVASKLPPPAEEKTETAVSSCISPSAITNRTASLTPYNFYLLRPHTPTASHVLVPLAPASTLSTSLKNRVVLEFPTIFVLPYPPEALPGQYMLEEQFLGYSEQENKELEALLNEVGMQGTFPLDDGSFGDSGMQEQDRLDDRKILDVLRQDLNGLQEHA